MGDRPLTLMTVHAHPDDETIVTGGVLARAAAEGKRVVLVCCTRGEVGEIRDPTVDPNTTPEQLGDIRSEELRRAAGILGVTEVEFLGYRDSGMAGTPENEDPRAFANADPEEAAGRLAAIIRRARPDVVVTYDEKGGYGHPDHIAVHRTTNAAIDMAASDGRSGAGEPWQVTKVYEVAWARSDIRRFQTLLLEGGHEAPFGDEFIEIFAHPDEEVTARVDVGPYVRQKREALQAHRTQIPDDDAFLSAPEELFGELLGTETFARRFSAVPAPDREDDLFAGL